MIEVTYSVSKSEYIEAQRLYLQRKWRKRRRIQFLACTLLAVVAVGIVGRAGSFSIAATSLAFLGYFALVGLIAVATWPIRPYIFGRRFRTESKFLTDVHVRIGPDGFESAVAGVGRGFTEWPAFSDALVGKTVVALVAGYTFRPIPLRVLTPDKRAELKSLIEEHIESRNARGNP